MLRAVLKILAYLSILTSTRTSSSYLDPPAVAAASYRSAPPNDLISSIDDDQADVRSWPAAYFMPRLVNPSSMLYQQLNTGSSSSNSHNNLNNLSNDNDNSKLLSSTNDNVLSSHSSNSSSRKVKKSRKSKKQSQSVSKQFYEVQSKRRTQQLDQQQQQLLNSSNSSIGNVSSTSNNEYPTAQIDGKLERELQELFGVEGAQKYQEYQMQQQIMKEQQYGKLSDGSSTTDIKEPQRKRMDGGLGAAEEIQDVSGAMINQMMSRTTRRQREYDVPLIRE